jgi:membrane-associated phospholipid phosphatase
MKRILTSLLPLLLILSPLFSLPIAAQTAVTPKAKRYYIDDIGQFVPTLMNFGLAVCGVESRHSWKDRLALTVTSAVICEGVTFSLKHIVHSRRPDGTDNHSFPSGHTARAFRGAEMLRAEYGWAWGAAGYAVAAGVGALRIHHHRHRFGDVAAGAAIGFLSARAAYLLLPLERKLFGWNKSEITAVAIPSFSPADKSLSLSASLTF